MSYVPMTYFILRRDYMKTRPCKFQTGEELDIKIAEYYKWAKENEQKVTVTGLAWFLEMDRFSVFRMEKWEEYGYLKGIPEEERRKISSSIKRAKQYIESQYEQLLYQKGSNTGAIFTLKNNYKWVDKQEIVTTDKKSIDDMGDKDIDSKLKELE